MKPDPDLLSWLENSSSEFLTNVTALWNQMGLSHDGLAHRHDTVRSVIKKMYGDLITEEEMHIKKVIDSIEKHGKESAKLAKELGTTVEDADESLGLIQLELFLRTQLGQLKEEKANRMREVLELKAEDKELCGILAMDPYYVSSSVIPTFSQMEALKKHIQDMKALKKKRFASFCDTKSAIVDLLERLDQEPNNSFERTVVCESDEAFQLSAANLQAVEDVLRKLEETMAKNKATAEHLRKTIFGLMTKLQIEEDEIRRIEYDLAGHTPREIEELKRKLTELEILKSEKMEQFIMATRKELELYWDHCYYSEQQRNKFKPQFSTEYSEAVLAAHEEEVDHIRAYYETNIELFKKVAQRQQLWEKRLELEAKEKNSKRLLKANFKDLENERKDRIRVSKRLPIVEEELREAMQHYLDVNGAPFLVGGVPYEQFLEEQICSHTAELEHEREAKKQTKKAHLIHETMYGSRPVTPANRTIAQKRKAEATESLSSTKRYKAGEVNQTAANSMKSPFVPKRTPVKSSRYGIRPTSARKILGDKNDSIITGNELPGSARKNHQDTFCSINSDRFLKDMPNSALTSTFQMAPPSSSSKRSAARSRIQESPMSKTRSTPRLPGTPVRSTPQKNMSHPPGQSPMFKTPSSRVLTPGANKSGKKKITTLRSGRGLPMLF